jgi:hypothetical protein
MGSGRLDLKLQKHEKRCGVGRAGSGRGRIRKEHRDAAWLSKRREERVGGGGGGQGVKGQGEQIKVES